MLANFLEKSKPITFILLSVLFFCFVGLALFTNSSITFYWTASNFSYLSYFLIVICTFLFFDSIVTKNSLTFENNYAFFFFVICLGIIPVSFLDEKMLFLNLLIFLFLSKIYNLKSSNNVIKKLFDSGFWLGIAFIIEPFSLIFGVLLYPAIYLYQKRTIKALLIPFIAFIITVFFYWIYCFWIDKVTSFYELFYWNVFYETSIYKSLELLIPLVFIGFFTGVAIIFKTPRALSIKNSFRKKWLLILLHFFIAFLFVVFLKQKNGSELLFLLFPISVILANGLELIKKPLYKSIIITLFLIITITSYFL